MRRLSIPEGESLTLSKRHPFRPNAATYTLYPGVHGLSVMINGQRMATSEFEIRA